MSTIKRFEDIEAWKEARSLSYEIYLCFKNVKDFSFRDQICRASISVMNNIAEGFERDADGDFQRFLKIAKGSSGEIRSMLWIAEDLKIIDKKTAEDFRNKTILISSKLALFIKYLNSAKKKNNN